MTYNIPALREALAKATPGDWKAHLNCGVINRSGPPASVGTVEIGRVGDFFDKELLPFNKERWRADAQIIVALVNAARAGLLDDAAIDEARGKTPDDALRALVADMTDFDKASGRIAQMLAILDGKNPFEPWPLDEDGEGIPGHVWEDYLSQAHRIVRGETTDEWRHA